MPTIDYQDQETAFMPYQPHWVVRWGILLLLLVVAGVLCGAWFVKYPDTISARIEITAQQPPLKIMAHADGKIIQLFVKDKEMVKQNDSLAIIENTANYKDVFILKKQLTKVNSNKAIEQQTAIFASNNALNLGGIQTAYTDFVGVIRQYQQFMQNKLYDKQIESLQKQIEQHQRLDSKLLEQGDILSQQLTLENKKRTIDQQLASEEVIAKNDVDVSQKQYLSQLYSTKNNDLSLINNQLQVETYRKNIVEIQQQYTNEQNKLILLLNEKWKQLQTELLNWEMQYVLKSPTNGTISLGDYWSKNQDVRQNQTVFTLIQNDTQRIARALVLPYKSGKMAVGQLVNIRLDNYPAEEYGLLKGTVASISDVPIDSFYRVQVVLSNGLKTTYHKILPATAQLSGNAQIITKDEPLLMKLLYQLREIWQR